MKNVIVFLFALPVLFGCGNYVDPPAVNTEPLSAATTPAQPESCNNPEANPLDIGTWQLDCQDGQTWTFKVTNSGANATAQATGPNGQSVEYKGEMSFGCVYLLPNSNQGPAVSIGMVASTQTQTVAIDGGPCKFTHDADKQ